MKSISGLSQRFIWEVRYDELVLVQDMSLAQ